MKKIEKITSIFVILLLVTSLSGCLLLDLDSMLASSNSSSSSSSTSSVPKAVEPVDYDLMTISSAFDLEDFGMNTFEKGILTSDISGSCTVNALLEKTLDLNGHSISSGSSSSAAIYVDGGIITIKDSVGNGKVSAGAADAVAVVNNGKLRIASGTFKTENANNAALTVDSGSTVEITGGSFYGNTGINVTPSGIITKLSGATVEATEYAIKNKGVIKVIESGNYFVTDSNPSVQKIYALCNGSRGTVENVKGGSFKATVTNADKSAYGLILEAGSNITFNGGVFEAISSGNHKFNHNDGGKYTGKENAQFTPDLK